MSLSWYLSLFPMLWMRRSLLSFSCVILLYFTLMSSSHRGVLLTALFRHHEFPLVSVSFCLVTLVLFVLSKMFIFTVQPCLPEVCCEDQQDFGGSLF
uniref:Uncharacterized protein n=1 Tax=Aegilops tauschii subsp. strangulata TaxID=200361 RepID=A0A453CE80_AEGTS